MKIYRDAVKKIIGKAKLHPHNVKLVQELKDGGFDRRMEFCEVCNENNGFEFNEYTKLSL